MQFVKTLRRRIPVVLAAMLVLGASRPTRVSTHVVELQRNRFAPADLRTRKGDTVRFVNGLGGPHNVQFEADSIAAAARALIDAAMPDKIRPLMSPMLILFEESYTLVVPDLAPGRYPYFCSPHYGNMRGALIVLR